MEEKTTKLERLALRVKDNPAVSLTLAGLLAYAAVRLTLGLFYGRLGLDPQDVGLGYTQSLEASAGLLAATVLYVVLVVLGFRLVPGGQARTRQASLRVA